MTSDQKKAYEWAKNQNYPSVAARYAKELAGLVDELQVASCARQEQERNAPLTLDELRQMDGEPVWCEIYIKGQPSFYGIVHGETVTGFISGDDKPANLAITNVGAYGLAWLAYRQKPERITREEDKHEEMRKP